MEELPIHNGFISRHEEDDFLYNQLHKDGVALLQTLSGEIWTDFNEHDPGITILENLIYTLTDIDNKINQPIIDILTEGKGAQLESGDNALFEADAILTTNPITKNDWRKIIIDQVDEVKNVWIDNPITSSKPDIGSILGWYWFRVELYDDLHSKEQYSAGIIESCRNKISEVFYKHRSLCDNLGGITFIKELEFELNFDLTLDDSVQGDVVFANLYYKIGQYYSSNIKFNSLAKLKSEGYSLNEIFNGPLLTNGFLKDSDLLESMRPFLTRNVLLKLINSEEGVLNVENFKIKVPDIDTAFSEQSVKQREGLLTAFSLGTIPKLMKPKSGVHNYNYGGVELPLDISDFTSHYNYITTLNFVATKKTFQLPNQKRDTGSGISIPDGVNLELANYYPIRNQFPDVYGVGEYGVLSQISPLRQAQSIQLKAYLLPFDQIMANFLSQLTNVYQLYSIDSNLVQSYFYQELSDMSKLLPLVTRDKEEKEEAVLGQWAQTLQKLNEQQDVHAIQRLNQIADNLLFRFAEKYPSYMLERINLSSEATYYETEEFHKKVVRWKHKLLRNYDSLSYNRAKGVDISKRGAAQQIALVKKIAYLMGVEGQTSAPMAQLIQESEIFIHLDYFQRKEKEMPSGPEKSAILNDFETNGLQKSKFTSEKNNVLTKLVQSSTSPFTISKEGTICLIEFKLEETIQFKYISPDVEIKETIIEEQIKIFREVSLSSERIYALEHILLAPSPNSDSFGFQFELPLTSCKTVKFRQIKTRMFEERNAIIEDQLLSAKGCEIEAHVTKYGEQYHLELRRDDQAIAHSKTRFSHYEGAVLAADEVNVFFEDFDKDQLAQKVACYAYVGDRRIHEDFFSFEISFVLPKLSKRFDQVSFQQQFFEIASENVPAHINFDVYWLDFQEILVFENYYHRWFKSLSTLPHSEHHLSNAAKLSHFLKRCHNRRYEC